MYAYEMIHVRSLVGQQQQFDSMNPFNPISSLKWNTLQLWWNKKVTKIDVQLKKQQQQQQQQQQLLTVANIILEYSFLKVIRLFKGAGFSFPAVQAA